MSDVTYDKAVLKIQLSNRNKQLVIKHLITALLLRHDMLQIELTALNKRVW